MPIVEVSIPAKIDDEIDRLVQGEEFMSREQAVEELLSKGISVYDTTDGTSSELTEDVFSQVVEDQQDPALDTE